MFLKKHIEIKFLAAFFFFLISFNNHLFSQVLDLNTTEQLENFIKKNPNSTEISYAQQKLDLLQQIKSLQKKVHDYETLGYLDNTEEFNELMEKYEKEKKGNTVNILNEMFDVDSHKANATLKVINESACNMIFKIEGAQNFQLPVPAKGDNIIVVPKGNYNLSGRMCGSVYETTKNIDRNFAIKIH